MSRRGGLLRNRGKDSRAALRGRECIQANWDLKLEEKKKHFGLWPWETFLWITPLEQLFLRPGEPLAYR
jgi:hypothetical protein